MQLTLNKIILYPSNTDHEPRVLSFKDDKINVITGWSQRGKSAIITIVDYCLGSSECNIPLGKIRQYVDCFAIDVKLNNTYLFLARSNPQNANSTGAMFYFFHEEKEFDVKGWLANPNQYKTDRDWIKNRLGDYAGFENISEELEVIGSTFDGPASFRDTSAFQFQSQNIIANPTTIFYNTDTYAHLKRLQNLFPLVLGYKSYEIILLEREIEWDKQKVDRLIKKQEDLERQYENWQSDIYEYYSTAISLGLSNTDLDLTSSTVELIKSELNQVVINLESEKFMKVGSSIRYAEKIEEFEKERRELSRKLNEAKNDLLKISQFDSIKNQYLSEVSSTISNRLKPIDWFLQQNGTNVCPFCDSTSEKAINQLLELKSQKVEADKLLRKSAHSHFSFEKEKSILKEEVKKQEEAINVIDKNVQILLKEDKKERNFYRTVYEFAGKIRHVLENLDKISPTGSLTEEIDTLESGLSRKRKKLLGLKKKFDREFSLQKVSDSIQHYVNLLPIEDKAHRKVLLDPEKSASIKIQNTVTGDTTFLSKLGSGANHMCYHIATMLGLHEYFLKLPERGKTNYVPSFLILDQPSQVYFPESYRTLKGEEDEDNNSARDEDVENTSLIFSACSKFIERTGFKTQIIILEHAPKETWKDIDNVHLVEEWRGKFGSGNYKALIPKDWLLD
jgi:hypothetical protein